MSTHTNNVPAGPSADAAAWPSPHGARLYLYAFVDAPGPDLTALGGLAHAALRLVAEEGVGAVVSAAPPGRLRPERRHLSAHQQATQALLARTSVVPVAFGTVVAGEGALRRVLRAHAGALAEQLERVRGRVEMTLRLGLAVDDVFRHYVERDAELRAARDALVRGPATHDLKVRAGRLFESALALRRANAESAVLERVGPACVETLVSPPRGEAGLLSLACLVERSGLQAFERAVEAAAEGFDDQHRFELSGPWAPHTFTTLRMDLASARAHAADQADEAPPDADTGAATGRGTPSRRGHAEAA